MPIVVGLTGQQLLSDRQRPPFFPRSLPFGEQRLTITAKQPRRIHFGMRGDRGEQLTPDPLLPARDF
jgi:hypothetical protein